MIQKTEQEIYDFCRGKYYIKLDEDLDEEVVEMFELWDDEEIEKSIQYDVKEYKKFMMD